MLLTHTHVTTLLQLLIQRYFSQLSSVLIVHNGGGGSTGGIGVNSSALQLEYLEAVELAFRNLSQQGRVIGLQWIDVSQLNSSGNCSGTNSTGNDSHSESDDNLDYDDELEAHLLRAVDILTEGFITILSDTVRFLHARYYASRNSELRLKDKFYLFLCEHENPEDFLSNELLQFYPHHLMVIPEISTERQTEAKKASEVQHKRYTTTKPAPTKSPTHPPSLLYNTIVSSSLSQHDINIQLWTQKYVGTNGNFDALLLDAFLPNETFAQNVELFPNKLNNLRGRTLHVGSVTYFPYVVTNYVPAGTGNVDGLNSGDANLTISYYGAEAEIVKTFCILRNCHLRVEAYGADNWGYIYENESSGGMLGDVYTQNVELAIGCIYNWYNSITETSTTIARSSVTILGPAPALFPAWRASIMPFSNKLWFFLIMTILLCALVMYLIRFSAFALKNWSWSQIRNFKHIPAISQALLDMFAVFIQQPSGPTSLHTFAGRFFLSTILCATITLENTYSGQLKSLLTIPLFTEAVNTIEKWSETDWKWYAPSFIWVQAVESSRTKKVHKMFKKFAVRDYDYLYNVSFHSDIGLGIERLMSGAFTFGDYITVPALESKIVLEDDLYFDWTRAVSIRGWPLMKLLDKHIRACIESGLYLHWERQGASMYLDHKIQEIILNLAYGHINKLPPQKLTLENISGAVFALLFGCLIACIVFVFELILYNMCKYKWMVIKKIAKK